jgi:hypothetical protein
VNYERDMALLGGSKPQESEANGPKNPASEGCPKDEWISVNDPRDLKSGDHILLYTPGWNPSVFVGTIFRPATGGHSFNATGPEGVELTHWQPLPPAPSIPEGE